MEWLSDEEQTAWRPFVGLLFRFPALLDAQLQKDAGISHFERSEEHTSELQSPC